MSNPASAALSINRLNLADCRKALSYAIRSDTPIHLIGPPGVGKSAIIEGIGQEIGLNVETLLLSQCDPTDVGGFPVVTNGRLDRLPLGPIKAACDAPTLLFLDELSCTSPAVQGASMQLIYARRAGDRKLHPGTRIVAASNPTHQSAGGWELALPLIGRMTHIEMMPTRAEVQNYFYAFGIDPSEVPELSDEDKKSPEVMAAFRTMQSDAMKRRVAIDFAATLESSPDLLQLEPPPGTQAEGKPWGAPRSWQRAVEFVAEALISGEPDTSPVFMAGLAGNVGDQPAAAYMAIRKIRHQLPGVREIIAAPDTAKVPTNVNVGIAVLGIIGQVAAEDPCPAWVYANRIQDREIRVAALNVLGRPDFGIKKHKSSKWFTEADKAQTELLRGIGNAMRA